MTSAESEAVWRATTNTTNASFIHALILLQKEKEKEKVAQHPITMCTHTWLI